MSDRDQWKQAVKDELNTLIDMGTWKLVPLPKGRKAVGCRMVLKRKFNLDGTVSRWKARAVLKGYAQREHIDYEETFAPVGKLETFRYLMALTSEPKRLESQTNRFQECLSQRKDGQRTLHGHSTRNGISHGSQNPCRRNSLQVD